jgi:hypothetical protein
VQLNQSAAVEIARRRDPGTPLAAPARHLLQRYEPVAFRGARVGEKVGVGRAGPLDNADAAQKSDPAARSVTELSGPMSR